MYMKSFMEENWEKIKETIRSEYDLSDVSYDTWIRPLLFHDIDDDFSLITILIPSDQTNMQKYISSKFSLFFKVTITELTGISYDIRFVLEENNESAKSYLTNINSGRNINFENANLNAKYTFDTFVVGSNNRFAHSGALAVAENPGVEYNPLYIYCGAGLGKTHLIHAIGHFILKNNPGMKVLYVNSEHFTNEVIGALRSGNEARMVNFREKYRTVDVFLLDDVQFIIGKERTQEEFFHTFNVLHSAGKQIILTSDKPPKDLSALEERLRTRFGWGLLVDMQAPDYETRMAILQKYTELQNKKIDNKILEYIADNVTTNVREMEGALNKVLAYTRIEKQELNMTDVEYALKDIINNEGKEITPGLIINIVAEQYNISANDIMSVRKNIEFVQPRHVVMYLCRKYTTLSYIQIAKILKKKDHTTVRHGDKKIADEITINNELRNKVETIEKLISP